MAKMAKRIKKSAEKPQAAIDEPAGPLDTLPDDASQVLPAGDHQDDADSKRPGRNLVVVESPAKAKTINRYLGKDYIVKASMGHVRDLPQRDIGVDIEHNFEPTYEALASRKKVLSELKKYAKTAPRVFLATDLDREGEAIAWHLAESLGVPPERICRVLFNEITASAIREAFAHPRQVEMDKVNAQQARRILDRIVGYKVSPLLWKKVSPGLSAGRVQSVAVRLIVERERQIEAFNPVEYWKVGGIFTTNISQAQAFAAAWDAFYQKDEVGNLPTRDAQQEFLANHEAFRAELASWQGRKFDTDNVEAVLEIAKAMNLTIQDVHRSEDDQAKGPARNRIAVIVKLSPTMPKFAVGKVGKRESRSNPYAPFTTASMQQSASVQLRFAASRTMRIAQQLYEGVDIPGEGSVGLITYMRTDSTHLSAEALGQVRGYIGEKFGQQYLPDKPNFFASGERAQEAHEAIRPTDVKHNPKDLAGSLTEEQYKLYELIWTRFVSCQMKPALWNVTEADIVAASPAGDAVFKAMGRQLAFDGFLRVAGLPKSGDQILPALATGQVLCPLTIDPTQHFTQAPPRYTEASLVKALEADGIGRPSTYASIIQTIQDRQYVVPADRALRPTDLGIVVTDKLVKHLPNVFDVHFTAHMEDELDKIEETHADWVAILREFYGPFAAALELAGQEMVHAKAETKPSDYVCPACGKPMVYRFSKNGRYLACTGYPECKTTQNVDADGKIVVRKEVNVPCPTCGKNLILRRSRFGIFLGCADYPACKGTLPCDKDGNPLKVVKEEDIKETCSLCGAPMVVRRKGRRPFLGCSKYPDCKNATPIPDGIKLASPPRPPPKEAGVNCPKCGKPMLIRTSARGEFIACSGFPRCRNAMNLDKLEEMKVEQAKNPIVIKARKSKKKAT
jgi:DNA topoisomerase-1